MSISDGAHRSFRLLPDLCRLGCGGISRDGRHNSGCYDCDVCNPTIHRIG